MPERDEDADSVLDSLFGRSEKNNRQMMRSFGQAEEKDKPETAELDEIIEKEERKEGTDKEKNRDRD